MKRIKMIIALVLAVSVVMATGIMLTGCGSKKNTDPTAATVAATAAAETTAANAANGTSSQNAQSGSSSQSAASSAVDSGAKVGDDGYITESEALQNVRERIGSGGTIVSYYKGYAPDGAKAWVVTTEPVTTADGATTVIYYTNYPFCIAENDYSVNSGDAKVEDDGYITESEALQNVRERIGSGGTIVSYYKGYAPDGAKAWVVTTEPVTTADGPTTVVYYTNYPFCIAENDYSTN